MGKTSIDWTDAVWNCVTGCSASCPYCYARRMSLRLAGRYGYPRHVPGSHPFDVTFHPDRLELPLQWKKPRRIFVNSMGDLFDPRVPERWLSQVMTVMDRAKHHTFLVLTKQAERMMEYLQMVDALGGGLAPLHIWWGVSVEDQAAADERIPFLLRAPVANRFISAEPLLGAIDLSPDSAPYCWYNDVSDGVPVWRGPDWVVCGPQSGPGAKPYDFDWILSLRQQCVGVGVPFFLKGVDGFEALDGWRQMPGRMK